MRKLALLLSFVAIPAFAATAYVNGVRWTYFVSGAEATIGDGIDAAIPASTAGTVVVPSSLGGCPVRRVADYALSECDMSYIVIPESVYFVCPSAFWCSYSLRGIYVSTGNPWYKDEGGVLFTRDGATLVAYPPLRSGSSYSVPYSVRTLGGEAFYGSRNLVSVSIPSTTTSMGWFAFEIGIRLQRIDVDASNPVYRSIDGNVYSKDLSVLWICPNPPSSFDIPEGVRIVDGHAFESGGYRVESLRLPPSLRLVGEAAFSNCNLSSLTIENGVSAIGACAFSGQDSLRSIYVPPSVVSIGDDAFSLWSDGVVRTVWLPVWFSSQVGRLGLTADDRVSFYDPSEDAGTPFPEEVHRFYSRNYRGHFFTIDPDEADELVRTNPNWRYEGIAFSAFPERAPGTVPLFRFYSKTYRGHFYTIDEDEMWEVAENNPNWTYEGVAYYVYPERVAGSVPVYRFWSKKYRHHFYTTGAVERDDLIANNPNWKYEGVAFWSLPPE